MIRRKKSVFGNVICARKSSPFHCTEIPSFFFVVAPCILVVLSPLFVQLMHTNYYKIFKQLKSFKIIIVAPTCFGLHKTSSRSSQPEVTGSIVATYVATIPVVLWLHMQPQYR